MKRTILFLGGIIMRQVLVAIFICLSLVGWRATAQEPGTSAEIVKACIEDCKDAINAAPEEGKAEAAHNCAEKKGRLNKAFRKSKCWDVNEKYEKAKAGQKK